MPETNSDMPQSAQPRLTTLAQDVSRTVMGGARRVPAGGNRALPEAVLTGRQLPVGAGNPIAVEFRADGSGAATRFLIPTDRFAEASASVEKSFTESPPFYYDLREDYDLPWWVYFQRGLALPADKTRDDFLQTPQGETLKLPATVLRESEAAIARPTVTLCRMMQDEAFPTILRADPVAAKHWYAAMCLQCPLVPTWKKTQAAERPVDPVFEVKGIPQSTRWFLDQLDLLRGNDLPKGSALRLYLVESKAGQTVKVTLIEKWVIARRNLTELARPGPMLKKADADLEQPYAAIESQPRDTLALIQMASITNVDGYYLRVVGGAFGSDDAAFALAIVLDFDRKETPPDEKTSRELPLGTNAISYEPSIGELPTVMRFEGMEHVEVDAYTPPGCVSVGFVRHMPWPAPQRVQDVQSRDDQDQLTGARGFAESIHLVDFQVNDADGVPIEEWRQQRDTDKWEPQPSNGDTRPPLFPMDPASRNEQDPLRTVDSPDRPPRVAAVRLAGWPADRSPTLKRLRKADSHQHYYRTSVRYAHTGVYVRLNGNGRAAELNVTARLRDLHGNRFLPDGTAADPKRRELRYVRPLFYADRPIPPAEWPGFQFAIRPTTKAGTFELWAKYTKPVHPNAGEDPMPQRRRKLQLILDQLKGAGDDDVSVTLINEPDGRVFNVDGLGSKLIEYIELVLRARGEEPTGKKAIVVEFEFGDPPTVRPLRFAAALKIVRTKHADLAPYLPVDPTLRVAIDQQVRHASSRLLFMLPGTLANITEDTHREFLAIASHFRLNDTQTALSRNRFNEHELWFVPNAILPSASPHQPQFWTARPLSNVLGSAEFNLPDFTRPAVDSNFPFEREPTPRSYSRQDFDNLGRRVFDFIETVQRPEMVTQRNATDSGALWIDVLREKDRLAKRLKDAALVKMFQEDGNAGAAGVRRIALDAFRNDLRGFYRIDTFVSLQVQCAARGEGITTFYGRTDAEFEIGGEKPAKFSDVVLNVEEDLTTIDGKTAGWIGMSYDLPPGSEAISGQWKLNRLSVVLTHLQLASAEGAGSHPFDRGQWLELVSPTAPTPEVILTWRLDEENRSFPVILRTFPDEPQLISVLHNNGATSPLPPDQFGQLTKWGWAVRFKYDFTSKDMMSLKVTYWDEDPAPNKSQAKKVTAPFANLLEVLIVADELAKQTWSAATPNDRAVAALAILVGLLQEYVGGAESLAKTNLKTRVDSFEFGKAGAAENLNNPLVKSIDVTRGDETNEYVATVEYDATENGLRLSGADFNACVFQPELSLTRNAGFRPGKTTTSSLIYECGPVIWPEPVRVSNAWGTVLVEDAPGQTVEGALTKIFEQLLGSASTQLSSEFALRVDIKHAFKFSAQSLERQVNPIALFPVDFEYSSPAALARAVALRYADWLAGADSVPAEMLAAINGPALHVGLQVALGDRDRALRVLLRIDDIVIETIRY